jgi:hypothetical protein
MDHVDTLKSMNNLAILYYNQGKFDKAEPLLVECLDKRKVLLRDDHVKTLHSVKILALLYKKQGKFDTGCGTMCIIC